MTNRPHRVAHPVGVLPLKNFHLQEQGQTSATAWYPSGTGGKKSERHYAGVFVKQARESAPFAEGLPPAALVLLLHGLRGSQFDLSWLGEALALQGMTCVAFEQPHVTAKDFHPEIAPRLWQRAAMVRAALDWVLAHGILRSMVNPTGALVAGHSAGASAALVAAGARISPTRFVARYPASGPVPAPVPRDKRIGAVLGLAPGTGEVFDDEGMASTAVPVLLFSGGRDWFCPDARNSARYAEHIPDCAWQSIPKAGHFAFKPCCSLYGKIRAPQICVDAWGVRRKALHARIASETLAFLRQHQLHAKADDTSLRE